MDCTPPCRDADIYNGRHYCYYYFNSYDKKQGQTLDLIVNEDDRRMSGKTKKEANIRIRTV